MGARALQQPAFGNLNTISGHTGIVVALPAEAKTLGLRARTGSFNRLSDHLMVAISGIGYAAALRAAQQLIADGATRLVSWGAAAGIAPRAFAGQLLLPTAVTDSNGEQIETDQAWLKAAASALATLNPPAGATIAHADSVLADAQSKALLHERTGAIAADMETLALARAAHAATLPWIAIRAISDTANTVLPPAVTDSIDATGRLSIARLLAGLARHPGQMTALPALARGFRAACNTLTRSASLASPDWFDCCDARD